MAKRKFSRKQVRSRLIPGTYSQDVIRSQLLGTGPSILGGEPQQITTISVPSLPILLTTTVTSGLIQSVTKLDPTVQVEDWATRFAADYEEFRILGARVSIMPCNGNTTSASASGTGISAYWIDEKYSNAPSYLEVTGKSVNWISNVGARPFRNILWIPNDILDMGFTSSGSSVTNAAYFKLYTDNSHLNAPATPASLFVLQIHFLLEFRGIQE